MKKKFFALIVAILFLSLGLTQLDFNDQPATNKPDEKGDIQVDLLVEKEEETLERKVELQSGGTVFRVLKQSGIEFGYEEFENGVLITSIDRLFNGEKSWVYYVNGEMPSKGVKQKVVKDNDEIKFKYQQSPF